MRKIGVLLAMLALPALAQNPLPPAPTKFVTDAAGVIPDDREYVLNERLAYFEHTTTHQVIVYVDRTIPQGTTLEEMAAEAIRMWAVGQAEFDNGVILFLFIDSRDSRIEVGYGLEGRLTDAKSKRILVAMRPLLRSGNYAEAIERGTADILDTIVDERPAPIPLQQPQPVAEIQYSPAPERRDLASDFGPGCIAPFAFLLFLFFVIAALKKGISSGVNFHVDTRSPNDTQLFNDPSPPWHPGASPSSDSFSSFHHGSSSLPSTGSGSDSGSGSGFSGGGGSGGGGGASDKW